MKNIKSSFFTLLVGLALLIQLVHPIPAYADGEVTPVPTDASVTTSTPEPMDTPEVVATPLPTDVVPSNSSTPDSPLITPTQVVSSTDVSVATDTLLAPSDTPEVASTPSPVVDTPTDGISSETPTLVPAVVTPTASSAPTDAPAETSTPAPEPSTPTIATATATPIETATTPADVSATDQPTLLETVQTIPVDTNVVVLDANGQPLSLASQAAANVIANSDPVWCPAGQAPTPGANGCSASYTTLTGLVSAIGSTTNQNGTIWITLGAVGDVSPVFIDGSVYTNWANNALTLQGGWNGISGNTGIGANSVFSVPISILNWNNNVTVNNVTINSSSNGGLLVTSSNPSTNVNIKNVIVNGASGFGLGVNISGGNVTINNSTISNTVSNYGGSSYYPWGDGADIFANGGNINVTNSHFDANAYDGIFTGNDVNINVQDSTFNSNQIGGLDTFSVNGIDINNTAFTGNGYYDLSESCPLNYLNLLFPDPLNISFTVDSNCNLVSVITPSTGKSIPPNSKHISGGTYSSPLSGSHASFYLDCKHQHSYPYSLPNGDKVEIVCPVSGQATIARLDNTILPGSLPAGYTYASAFQVDITQLARNDQGGYDRKPVSVITQGGYIIVSFVNPSQQAGANYSILYWNNGSWIPLKDYMLNNNNTPQTFDLIPGDDTRMIISGVNADRKISPARVETSTNFPGIFVLAQH